MMAGASWAVQAGRTESLKTRLASELPKCTELGPQGKTVGASVNLDLRLRIEPHVSPRRLPCLQCICRWIPKWLF